MSIEILVGIGVFTFLMLYAIERHLSGILKELKEQRRDPRSLVWLADIVRETKDIRIALEKRK